MDAKAAAAAVEAVVEADRRDSGAHGGGGDADGSDNGRVGGRGSDGGAGEEEAVEDRGGRGGHGEAGGDGEDEEESGDGMADEEEAVMRRMMAATGAARMHPSKERRSGKYRAAMVTSWSAWPRSYKKQQSTSRREQWEARGRG